MKKNLDYYMAVKYPLLIAPFEADDFTGFRVFLLDIPAIESIAASREEALADLEEVKKEWFSYAISEGVTIPEPNKSYLNEEGLNGRITLRIPQSLHRKIIQNANIEGVSQNAYMNALIERGISNNDFLEMLTELRDSIRKASWDDDRNQLSKMRVSEPLPDKSDVY